MFKNKNILIIGDVMLDSYLFGDVTRISPEAPVPIVNISNKKDKLGGAANVAANIKNLGGNPILCSIVGNDQNGKTFLSELEKLGIKTNYIFQSKNRITTVKTRIIGNNHQMLRIDEEVNKEMNGEQNEILSLIKGTIDYEKIDCILFQDYDKGVINKKIIKTIIEIGTKFNIPIAVDPKKKNFSDYSDVTLFKPNFKEFKEGLNINSSDDKLSILKKGAKKLHNKNIKIVFITLSESGIFISYKKNDKIIDKIIPGIPRDVIDVSGAGDTVISVASMLLNDINVEEIANISNIAGGLVCEEIGVVPINKEKLLKEYKKINQSYE